ncbi:MAG: FecR domain-containing protein, partial [Myxococcota bacterium]
YGYLRGERSRAQLELAEVAGEVHIGRAAGAPAVVRGTVLQLEDRVSTGPDGRAVLRLGRETQIRVGPESAVQVTAIDEAGVSLELEDGLLQATVRPESGAVRVANRGREVLATNGEFTVGVSDDVMQVGATQGTLSMSGVDAARVEQGQQVTVVDRRATVSPIPEELLLAVQWPAEARTRAEITRVTGTTQPGASVRLRGSFGVRTVTADREGRFEAELPLVEGDNRIAVDATDLLGQSTTVEGMLQTRDTRGPSFHGGVDYRPPP